MARLAENLTWRLTIGLASILSAATIAFGVEGREAAAQNVASLQEESAAPAPKFWPGGYELAFGVYDPYASFKDSNHVSIEHIYIPWQDLELSSLDSADQYARERGRELLITVEPWSWSPQDQVAPQALYAGIIGGQYDQTIDNVCGKVQSLKSARMIRWGHEMDLNNGHYPWAQWQPAQYISAYRHFVDRCRVSSPKSQFVWSPRGEENLEGFYPGDEYVDVIGLSVFGYQEYEIAISGRTVNIASLVRSPYDRVKRYHKRIMITEFGCHGDEKYDRDCHHQAMELNKEFPLLTALIYFNDTDPYSWPQNFGSPDWRLGAALASAQLP